MWINLFAKVALTAMGFAKPSLPAIEEPFSCLAFAKSSQPAMKGLIFDSRFAKPLFPAI